MRLSMTFVVVFLRDSKVHLSTGPEIINFLRHFCKNILSHVHKPKLANFKSFVCLRESLWSNPEVCRSKFFFLIFVSEKKGGHTSRSLRLKNFVQGRESTWPAPSKAAAPPPLTAIGFLLRNNCAIASHQGEQCT